MKTTFTIERTWKGDAICMKHGKHHWYFGGIQGGSPVWYCDLLYARHFKTEKTLAKYLDLLNISERTVSA